MPNSQTTHDIILSMQEHELIRQFFTRKSTNSNVRLSVGDDAAILQIPEDSELVTSIDTMVRGVNFPESTSAEDIGYKSLAVSLSDMAAMGAKPETVLLALTLPEANENWLSAFSKGFYECADAYDVTLIGGDITIGPLSVTTTVNGFVPKNKAILRSGAKPGDLIYVTGNLGDAGFALLSSQVEFMKALNRPTPRVNEGIALRDIANSAIDISDGLATDLEKICIASNVGAIVHTDKLPLSKALTSQIDSQKAIELALTAGDDFELCFTAAPDKPCDYHCIGEMTNEKGLKLKDKHGTLVTLSNKGYEHF